MSVISGGGGMESRSWAGRHSTRRGKTSGIVNILNEKIVSTLNKFSIIETMKSKFKKWSRFFKVCNFP
jgi:hypothetical protein